MEYEQKRARNFFQQLYNECSSVTSTKHRNVLVVSHHLIMRAIFVSLYEESKFGGCDEKVIREEMQTFGILIGLRKTPKYIGIQNTSISKYNINVDGDSGNVMFATC